MLTTKIEDAKARVHIAQCTIHFTKSYIANAQLQVSKANLEVGY